jgi:hypothetical protein
VRLYRIHARLAIFKSAQQRSKQSKQTGKKQKQKKTKKISFRSTCSKPPRPNSVPKQFASTHSADPSFEAIASSIILD